MNLETTYNPAPTSSPVPSPERDSHAIIQAFDNPDNKYQRKVLDEAIAHQKEVTPGLLAVLAETLTQTEKYTAEQPELHSHIYASYLLSHFREAGAHALFLKIFSFPAPIPEDLYGDVISQDGAIFLYNTCDGSAEGIKRLAADKAASPQCRASAARALGYCVAGGLVDRTEVITFLCALLDEADETFGTLVALNLLDFYPAEAMETIERAYQRGALTLRRKDFEPTLQKSSPELSLSIIRQELIERNSGDIHDATSWWALREEEEIEKNDAEEEPQIPFLRVGPKIGRNDPCSCGSGKKFKKCCAG